MVGLGDRTFYGEALLVVFSSFLPRNCAEAAIGISIAIAAAAIMNFDFMEFPFCAWRVPAGRPSARRL